MSKKKLKVSRFGRLTKLGTSLAVAAGHVAIDIAKEKSSRFVEGAEQVRDIQRRIKAAKEIIKTMGELKGALMKIGQMVSISDELILPKEISALFKELQKNAPSMPRDQIRDAFYDSFKKAPELMFKEFDYTPMAAASIGQVHRAVTQDDQEVAIKVQYPDIVKAIQNDFKNIDRIKKVFELLVPVGIDIEHIIDEIKDNLILECDYEKELENIEFFRDFLSDSFSNIKIPKVFPEYSTKSILTMELVKGDSFEETLNYSPESRNKLGQLLYDSFNFSLYHKGCLHTDPQNGNYLFKEDEIILLDFGSVRKFPSDFIKNYIFILRAAEKNDLELYRKYAIELQIFDENEPVETVKRHFDLVKKIYLPYTLEGSYAISDVNPVKLVSDFIKTINLRGRKAPLKEFLMLDRANLGIYSKIKGWNAEVDWVTSKEKYWSEHEN